MRFPTISICLPGWMGEFLSTCSPVFPAIEDRMRLVIDIARHNVERGTGGPFGAGVFDSEGRLIAPGVNLVMASNCSVLHAEIIALSIAQRILGRYDIGDGGRLRFDLVSSVEPCAMCFGAIPWAGVSRLICGARDEDARAIGFDEGPKLHDWAAELRSRRIDVVCGVLRDEAVSVLRAYVDAGGIIYNAGHAPGPCP